MNIAEVVAKMNVYLLNAADVCRKWLEPRLKSLEPNDWWSMIVLPSLSELQQQKVNERGISTLQGLDLQAVLTVARKNIYSFRNIEFYTDYYGMKDSIRAMFEVRNDWAHPTPEEVTLTMTKTDLSRYIDFMERFGGDRVEINEAKEFRASVEMPNYGNPIRIQEPSPCPADRPAAAVAKPAPAAKVLANPFELGVIVKKKSDPSQIGPIVGIQGSGENTEYQVWIGNSRETLYADQILLADASPERCNVTIDELKILLTAQQLCSPTNDQLYSLNAARVDFVPYQFRPALKMIHAERPRILVADSVGVGKTIEAGLILRELQARNDDFESVLIICPKPLVAEHKWRSEMKRFDENFTELDGALLREAINECDKDGEWPVALRKTILPYSLMTKELLTGKGRQKGLLDLEEPVHFDLVIIDEAHHIRHSNTGAYRVARYFTDNADAVVMLTATPVQTDDDDLYTLLNTLRPDVILDKKTFKEMQEPNAEINAAARLIRHQAENWRSEAAEHLACAAQTSWGHSVIEDNPTYKNVMATLKSAQPIDRATRVGLLQDVEGLHSFADMINRTRRQDIQNDFCVRRPQSVSVHFTPEQKELYEALMDFESHALSYLHNNVPLEFMMSTLMRQASSCIFGLAPLLKGMVTRRLGDILSDYCDEDGALTVNELENLSMGSLEAEFRAMANHVIELSENLPQTDEKLERLLEVIETKSHQQNNKIILFSSFRHTLRYIEQHLAEKGYRVAQVNGSVKDEERLALRQRFELPVNNANALDILLFTEVGCEGLDYQFCDFMINYDLPWNPMAIEQRIGRIDRRGQKSDTVIICNLVTEDTIDAKIYHRCLERIGVFESSIGECAGILGDMTQKINEAVFDSSLTQQEKEEKIEKNADNEVSRANEMKRLEDESKQLFGIDISGYVLDRKVMDAENPWIGERYIQALVTEYLYRILGEKKNYIQGEGAHKVLTLSGENRATLKTKLRNSRMKKSAMYNQWMDYLKGSDTRISVTFNQEEAARDRNAIFFTAVHPLVKMAAAELHKKQEVYIKLIVDASDYPVPCGDYPFLIVERTIVGMRKEVRIVPISEINLSASDFCDLLEAADYKEIPDDCTDKQWEKLSQLKREQQQQALAQLTIDVKEKCDYRRAAVLKSYQFRKEDLLTRIEAVDDESIKRMYTSQLNSLETEKNSSLNDLENIQNCAAVEENVIVRGIITVCD